MLIIDLVRHMKAKNRQKWTQPQDERPLSKLGLRQAVFHADAMLEGDPIAAIYSSPAVRCTTTIAPVSQRLGIASKIEPLLSEGRSSQDTLLLLDKLRHRHPSGRIVLCSHGDTIPAILSGIAASAATPVPSELRGFGGWYRVNLNGDTASIERIDPPAGFANL